MNFTQWQDLQLQGLLTATTEDDLFAVLSAAARDLGFEYCAYGLRMPLPVSNPKVYMRNNYSPHWQERYARLNYVRVDPTVAHGMKSVLPLVWTDKVFDQCQEFWEDARHHGLRVGWAQSSYDARGVGGLLTLARSHDRLSESELRDHSLKMSWLVQVAHEGMTRVVSIAAPSGPALTARELEVLRWTADGKTSGEVGQIMHISERTVNFHVNNALAKLGAVNKTAGVVKAAMLRLL
ncbi:LuxR family transcriptional regulator [Pseudoduganella plicata]|uniref:LuxR family transcriptional regulator n=1 Tax=Pseudoduganella plicata TaxID=321984 RepID=A0AA87Y7F5_9BURK|nr:LuxR family transcriptional regulator [Pseudoduganella plicata]GGZ01138.1 LuxR family transcriptional regulator [Pseudoduganella plicata]